MTWPKIVLLSLYAVTVLLNVSSIGKPRRPLTSGTVAASIVVTGVMAWLVVIA